MWQQQRPHSNSSRLHTQPHTPYTPSHTLCVCVWRRAQVTGQSCCFFCLLLLPLPGLAKNSEHTVRAIFRAIANVKRRQAQPQQPSAPSQRPQYPCLPPVSLLPGVGVGGVLAPCSVLRCSSLWTRKRNVSHKMLSQRFTTRLLRITRPPPPLPNPRLGQLWQASSRSVAVSASASACVASSNLFYDNIRAFSAEI